MGDVYEAIDDKLQRFIAAQHVFFVATAPHEGHVNVSPKGLDSLRVLGPREIAYIDYVGSGAETIAHVRENGRITIMLCSFEGPPKVLRLHGRGEIVEPQDPAFDDLARNFTPDMTPRSIVRVDVERISDSCGYGVPVMTFEAERTLLRQWSEKKGDGKLVIYQSEKNAASIDGLPALRWVEQM